LWWQASAHELNNPMATISLRIESVLAGLAPEDPRRQPLEVVEGEVERMNRLVANLLQFSRRITAQISTLDVGSEIEKSLELIDYRLRGKGQEARGRRLESSYRWATVPTVSQWL